MSLIDEAGERFVRMAHLATVGSHRVNGVARLHSDLLTQTVMHDFAELWPEKFCNVTNGVTPRLFVAVGNRLAPYHQVHWRTVVVRPLRAARAGATGG
jgi:starch phosphorylase